MHRFTVMIAIGIFVVVLRSYAAEPDERPFRLESVNLKQRVLWGATAAGPDGSGLAFGGQDQDADDGRPHTRILVDGQWRAIHEALQSKNPLQAYHERTWEHRNELKQALAKARFLYFKGLAAEEESAAFRREVAPRLEQLQQALAALIEELPREPGDEYANGQIAFAQQFLNKAKSGLDAPDSVITPDTLQRLHDAQIGLELAAECFDAEPPPRALDCGAARKSDGETTAPAQALVYDAKTRRYVLFGGDHLDYLTNDLWVFDPAAGRWQQQHPAGAPPPRANHRLESVGNGTLRMAGGYTYASNTDYCGGQYLDLHDGPWIYDMEAERWSTIDGDRSQLVPAYSRVYRTGPFHPDYYLQGERPNAAAFEAWLQRLPVNEWIATDPPYRPRLNRDWGTARIDPDRDLMLRWSGGHSAHGGTDVPHYHFSTNRWELAFPVEFPLGQLYSNTSYPNGFNFNLRPWMTGHTYQNYAYDPPSRKMIKAGRPRHHYIYDPDVADWIGRGDKPEAMQYNSCFYTLTLTATPNGAVCWDKNGSVHRFNCEAGTWAELELVGDRLPGAYVDNSTICYDSQRDRLLIINKKGFDTPFDGQVWSVDMKTLQAEALSPAGMERAAFFANIDKCCYDAANDLMLLGTYLKDAGDQTPTPAYDCAANGWISLNLKYKIGERYGQVTRAFPHQRSDALMYDARRNRIWGTDTNSQVYVLRLQPGTARIAD